MGRYADPRTIPFEPCQPGPAPRVANPTAARADPLRRPGGLIRLTCYSTEPGDDPGAQIRAGAFEVTPSEDARAEDWESETAGCQGVVLVATGDGRVRGRDVASPDLFCLAGYPEASHCPGEIVFTVGHRAAATQILRAAGHPWYGDHVVLPAGHDAGLLAVFLETLHHLAAHNLAALMTGTDLIGWRDVFPSLRIRTASPRSMSHPGR